LKGCAENNAAIVELVRKVSGMNDLSMIQDTNATFMDRLRLILL
jgi:hypothetical protein